MGRAGAGLFLVILMVAALGAGYLAVNSGRQASTSTSTSQGASTSTSQGASTSTSHGASTSTSSVEEPTSTTASAVAPSGLELRVELDATTMEPGRTLAANVTLFNTLDENLSLPFSAPGNLTSQIAAWNDADFLCGIGCLASYVAGFAPFSWLRRSRCATSP